ncbi:MAG: HAD-IIB family hydrolase [Myxococcota bacterium]
MRPLNQLELPADGLLGVLMDIDDTLTEGGKLVPAAFQALSDLSSAGLLVIPVTGRPAGWCDLIARQWPVDAVIGENGAFAFYEAEQRLQHFFHPAIDPERARAQLDTVRDAILSSVNGARVSKDQPYRLFDLAIDFREEPPDLGLAAAEQIRAIFEACGARAKVSSIHVNGWFGDYDKLSMTQEFLRSRYGYPSETIRDRFVFVGDSPNDGPMFEFFPLAVGVANVRRFADQLAHAPAFVTESEGGTGFAEVTRVLLEPDA